ncbi:hypothetical protein BGX26_004420 [Mortierella sp. AD094]|nr:hypothetical protein BGX26_004420 [Mortierella sp. AD094]
MSTPSHTHHHPQQSSGTLHSHTNGHPAVGPATGGGPVAAAATSEATSAPGGSSANSTSPVPHIRIVPHLDAPRSLHFEVVDKDVPEGFVLKIGRFTDKQALPNRVTFKSKVVSRGHAEIFTEQGKFYIRDTKSSSGTFLNHARLSPPGVESKPTQLKDGDVVQLGVDYQGGTQEIYRCVKMRLELNRSWQQQANPFRMNTLKAIRSLTTADAASSTDCCICLFRIASFQSLFVAPCSHVYHFKCIRPLLMANHPGFLCPLCRTFANLEDSVEIDDPIEEDIPAEEVAAAIEKAHRAQEVSVEQVCEEPIARPEIPVAEVLAEEVYAPTPPSEQAHTFQPPEIVTYPAGVEGNNDQNQVMLQARVFQDAINEGNLNSREAHQDTVMASNSAPAPQSPLSGATSLPMNISAPSATVTSTSSPNTSVQQSPSSAFFMAPSPPLFSSQAGTTPISFGSPQQRSQQSHGSVSPSNQIAAAGSMIQNFVRNISIPSRGRTRTNSNSPLNPMVHQQNSGTAAVGPSSTTTTTTTDAPPMSPPPPLQPVDIHGDVFGKTLVVTPPTSAHGSGNSRPDSHNSNTGRASELGPVLEMESELSSSSSLPYNMNNGSRVDMDGVLVEDGHSSEQGGQDTQQQQHSQYSLQQQQQTAAAETSV